MKFDLKIIFRRLIMTELLLLVAVVVTDIYLVDQLPPEIVRYNESASELEFQNPFVIAFFAVYAIGYLGSIILLWRYSYAGRFIYTALVLIGAISSIGLAPQIFHPFSAFCLNLSTVITGIIIGLIYFSDLSAEFQKNRHEASLIKL